MQDDFKSWFWSCTSKLCPVKSKLFWSEGYILKVSSIFSFPSWKMQIFPMSACALVILNSYMYKVTQGKKTYITSTSLTSKLHSIAIIIIPVLSGHFWYENLFSSLFICSVEKCSGAVELTGIVLGTWIRLFHGSVCISLSSCAFMAWFCWSDQTNPEQCISLAAMLCPKILDQKADVSLEALCGHSMTVKWDVKILKDFNMRILKYF